MKYCLATAFFASVFLCGMSPRCLHAQIGEDMDDHDDSGPVQAGYAIVTPSSGDAGGLRALETFGFKRGRDTMQAVVVPGALTKTGNLFINVSKRLVRDIGLAISNPGGLDARLTFEARDEQGFMVASTTIFIPPRRQISRFVSEIFAGHANFPDELIGSLTLTSNRHVAIVAIRFRGDTFSTLPITDVSTSIPVPSPFSDVGGEEAVILPHFATGGGWSSEIVLTNLSGGFVIVRLDLFAPDGSPLIVRLNGISGNSFLNLRIRPGGTLTIAPRNSRGDSRF